MSLYDKAKVFFSGAAGAGANDVAYNIKPEEKLKVDELITNNKLLTSDGWSFSDSNITVASNKIVFNNAAQYATARWDTDVFEEGKTYKVSFKVEDFKGGASNSKLLAQQANNTQINTEIDRDGNYSFYYTPGAPDGTTHQNKFQLKTVTTSVEAKVSDFSIKEVEQKANDFSFSRGSNLTATYEGADGLIKKTRENLLTYSNNFDNSIWAGSSTWTSGQSGYDGSTDAWSFNKSSPTGSDYYNQFFHGLHTFSIYAKKQSSAGLAIYAFHDWNGSSFDGNKRVMYDLSDGTLVYQSAIVSTTSEAIGSDWWRISMTVEQDDMRWYLYTTDGTQTLVDNVTVTLQDAQLEQGLVATPYIDRTGAAYSTAGIREDEPRYDYSLDNALPPVLMLEPERTNELPHSEYLDSFVKNTGITLTSNTTDTKSPEGLYNATKVVSTNSSGGFYKSGLNITADTVNSIYLKGAAGGEFCRLKDPGGYGGFINITLTTDWVRYELKSTYSGNAGEQHQGLYVDDIASGSTIYAWGAQKEKGSYATSYIPTYGSAATRKGEAHNSLASFSCALDNPLSNKYTFILDLRVDNLERPTTSYDDIFTARDASGSEYAFRLEGNVDTSDDPDTYSLRVFAYSTKNSGAALSTPHDSGIQLGQRNKIAIVFDETVGIKVFLNGNSTPLEEVLIGDTFSTDSTKTLQSNSFYEVKTLDGGANPRSKTFLYGVQAYDEALSDAECVSLTTIS